MLNIVVIEDNDDLRAEIVGALGGEGHHVVGLDCAETLAEQKDALAIDLMVIDLNLPGEDGISLSRRIRSVQPGIGIVMVTARSGTIERQIGYESGADIYLTKPFSLEELSAAINALSRRLKSGQPASDALLLDPRRLVLTGPRGEVSLSAPETAVLAAFVRAVNHRIETWQIAEILERQDELPGRNAINVMLFRLGRKLQQAGTGERPIRAIRRFGYQLCTSVAVV